MPLPQNQTPEMIISFIAAAFDFSVGKHPIAASLHPPLSSGLGRSEKLPGRRSRSGVFVQIANEIISKTASFKTL
jgi:hypothetical protein